VLSLFAVTKAYEYASRIYQNRKVQNYLNNIKKAEYVIREDNLGSLPNEITIQTLRNSRLEN
jgi:hypothetical protein